MKFHIIRNNEKLEDIMSLYDVTKDELKENNRHIRVWDKLIPGTKLKIPVITESIDNDVSQMEPFIEDYYPKVNYQNQQEVFKTINDDTQEVILEQEDNEEVPVEIEQESPEEVLTQQTTKPSTTTKEDIMKEVARYPKPTNSCDCRKQQTVNPYYTYPSYPLYYYPYYYTKK